MKHFDLIVLGTGVAGTTVAEKCREAGWRVAIVDSRPYGGTCALRGCDAKKVLMASAEVVDAARRLRGKGVAGDVAIDWAAMMHFKRTFTDAIPASREQRLLDLGIVTLHGAARFVDQTILEVGGERLHADHVHVATGSRPRDLPMRGVEYLKDSDEFLELEALPKRVVFVGSGYIAFELAHVCASAGAEVTMIEAKPRPLSGFDGDLVSLLVERTRKMGVDLRLATRVAAIEKQGETVIVQAVSPARVETIEADLVLHAAGRVPAIADLQLAAAGVEHDEQGIVVNEYMQSVSNPAVYAAGDVAKGGLPLTPVASFEAHVAAANLLEGSGIL